MRKLISLLSILFVCSSLFAEDEEFNTYALIIGISDYDVDSFDLNYAHKDAMIFYDYLRSSAGGAVPDSNIVLLIDKDATYSAIHEGFKEIIHLAGEGDKVIVYFAGHGDVERDQFNPLGYFLARNTLKANYRTNGVRIRDFNDYATTLTFTNKASVIFYIDACRSGELVGEVNEGSALAAREVRKKQRNVLKVMSCQPEQLSLEAPTLDNGRGLFSYYLIKGLMGEADLREIRTPDSILYEHDDYIVSIEELQSYLSKKVKTTAKEAFKGHQQNPEINGGRPDMEIAYVDEDLLAKFKRQSIAAFSNFNPFPDDLHSDSTGDNSTLIAGISNTDVDDNEPLTRGLNHKSIYPPFDHAIANDDLLESPDNSAYAIYEQYKKTHPKSSRLRAMKRTLIVKLQDEAQNGINAYLNSDQKELDRRIYSEDSKVYEKYPVYLAKAAELVGPEDKTYNAIKVKQKYFEGINLRLKVNKSAPTTEAFKEQMKKVLAIQQEALTYDDSVAYIHNEIGVIYLKTEQPEKAEVSFRKAMQLTPQFALPYANLAGLYIGKAEYQKAEEMALKAIALNPNYMNGYVHMGIINELTSNFLKAEYYYHKAIHTNWRNHMGFESLAYNYTLFGDYELADQLFKEADFRKKGIIPEVEGSAIALLANETFVESVTTKRTEAELLDAIRKDPKDHQAWGELAKIYVIENRKEEAENCFNKVIDIIPGNYATYLNLGDLYVSWNRPEDAIAVYYQPIHLSDGFSDYTVFNCAEKIWSLYEGMDRNEEAEQLISKYVYENPGERAATLFHFYSRMVEKYKYNPTYWYKRALLLYDAKEDGFRWHSSEKIKNAPDIDLFVYWQENGSVNKIDNINLEKPWNFFWGELVIHDFEKVLQNDLQHPSAPDIYLKQGEIHAIWADLYKSEVFKDERKYVQAYSGEQFDIYDNFIDKYQTAIRHTTKSHNIAPEQLVPIHQLIDQYTAIFEHDKALYLLEKLNENKQLDTRRRQLLVRNYILRNDFKKAEALLDFGLKKPIGADREELILECLYNRLNTDYKKAIASLQMAMKIDKNNPHLQYRLGTLYAMCGDEDRNAIKWLGKAFKNGFNYKKVVAYDPDLSKIRDLRKFNQLLKKHDMI